MELPMVWGNVKCIDGVGGVGWCNGTCDGRSVWRSMWRSMWRNVWRTETVTDTVTGRGCDGGVVVWERQFWRVSPDNCRLTKPTTGVKPKLMRQLYIADPPNKQEDWIRNSGSVTFLHNLQKIQHTADLAITRTLRTSPNNYIDIHANILPLELALTKACHRAIIHYLILPDTNPIHKIIQDLITNPPPPPNKHPSPLYKLLTLYQLTNSKIEMIKPIQYLQNHKLCPNSIIDNSRKKSIHSELINDANFDRFKLS